MTVMAIDDPISRRALRALQRRVGGDIIGNKLYPIGPILAPLCPLEPACELHRRWHVVHCEPQHEHVVAEGIRTELKLDAYLPTEPRRVRVNALKHRTVQRPMLVGYVFAGFDISENWEPINELRGVLRLLMAEMKPIPVADNIVDDIRRLEVERGVDRRNRPRLAMRVGRLVRVLDPLGFAGLLAYISAVDDRKRQVRIDLDLFGRLTPMWLRPEQVEAV